MPAWLSNGDHVLTAAEVAAAGGHGANVALRKVILAGGVARHATGGPVGRLVSGPGSSPLFDYALLASAMHSSGGDVVTLNAYGMDADAAVRRVQRDYDFRKMAALG